MTRKWIALLMVLLVLVLPGCGKKDAPETQATTETEIPTTETEGTVPAMEDSVFDEPAPAETEAEQTEETEAPETTEATEAAPEPTTKPAGQGNAGSGSSSVKPQNKPSGSSGSNTGSSSGAKPTQPTEPPQPAEPTQPTQQPTQPAPTEPPATTEPSSGAEDSGEMTYEKFQAMSPSEQQAFVNSFPSLDAFFEWYNAAKAKYEAEHPPIDVGDGSFDMNDIAG